MDKNNVALVLSGGGARGFAHIGVIEELLEEGYEISSVAGTSMGALVGGIYSRGALNEFRDWATSFDNIELLKFIDITLSNIGLIKGEKLFNAMMAFIPDIKIEDLPIPYSATAADIINHREYVFTSGSLYEAIRASIAIPSVFTPVEKDGLVLVDGGVLNNVPISNVKRNGDDLLAVVHVNADIPSGKSISKSKQKKTIHLERKWLTGVKKKMNASKDKKHDLGFLSFIDNTLATAMLRLAQVSINEGKPDILIEVSRNICGTYDFYKAADIIEAGRIAARKTIKNLKKNEHA